MCVDVVPIADTVVKLFETAAGHPDTLWSMGTPIASTVGDWCVTPISWRCGGRRDVVLTRVAVLERIGAGVVAARRRRTRLFVSCSDACRGNRMPVTVAFAQTIAGSTR
jgi:hypothetical protein